MHDKYLTISLPSEGLYKEKGSKFIAFACPVCSEEEIKQHQQRLKKEYYDARHHCFAYRLGVNGEIWRAVDDGEPSGTGGKPILGQLLSYNVTNVVIFVVRYFGGIKLGVAGLINAYKAAAIDSLQNAEIVEKEDKDNIFITFDYIVMNDVMKVIKDEQPEIAEQQFEMICKMQLLIRKGLAEALRNKLLKIESLIIR